MPFLCASFWQGLRFAVQNASDTIALFTVGVSCLADATASNMRAGSSDWPLCLNLARSVAGYRGVNGQSFVLACCGALMLSALQHIAWRNGLRLAVLCNYDSRQPTLLLSQEAPVLSCDILCGTFNRGHRQAVIVVWHKKDIWHVKMGGEASESSAGQLGSRA